MEQDRPERETGVLVDHVPLGTLFRVFLLISAKAWGGGSGTTYTMQRELVRRGWITPALYALDLGLSRVIPGINLLAVAVTMGYRLNGPLGSLVALVGLMLPASIVTLVLTVGFIELAANPIGNAMVRGAIAVTAAFTLVLAVDTARDAAPWRERRAVIIMTAIAGGAFVASALLQLSVAMVIITSAALGALFLRPPARAAA